MSETHQSDYGAAIDPNGENSHWIHRKGMWNWIYGELIASIKVRPLPPVDDLLAPITPWRDFTQENIEGLVSGYPTPPGEDSELKDMLERFISIVRAGFPQLIPGLLPVLSEPEAMLATVWCERFQKVYPHPPELPSALRSGLDIGELLIEGPLTFMVRRKEPGRYVVDLSFFTNYRHHPGARSLATVTELTLDPSTRRLHAESIRNVTDGQVFRPGDPGWLEAQRTVACGVFTHHAAVGHLGWGHFYTAGSFAIAGRNSLRAGHPLKSFLWPHIFGTLDVNNLLAPVLLGEHSGLGVVGDAFNIEHTELWRLETDVGKAFNLNLMNPREDRRARGCDDGAISEPTVEDAIAIWDIILGYAREYVGAAWPTDAAAGRDEELLAFLIALDEVVPNGIKTVVADPLHPTLDGVARLLATEVYVSSVWHRIVGTLGWHYQTWPMYVPSQVYDAGGLPPADVFQRFFMALMATNSGSRPLLEDFSHIAAGPEYAAITKRFQDRLRARQAEMEAEGADRHSRVFPNDLCAVISV